MLEESVTTTDFVMNCHWSDMDTTLSMASKNQVLLLDKILHCVGLVKTRKFDWSKGKKLMSGQLINI